MFNFVARFFEMTENEYDLSANRMEGMFRSMDILDFDTHYSTHEACLRFLAESKWRDGFVCRHCGHTNYCEGKTPYSRRCTRCKREESATAHTIFHRCRIHLPDAFRITYLVCGDAEISTYELSRRLNLRQMTCWKFKKKISECLEKRADLIAPELAAVFKE